MNNLVIVVLPIILAIMVGITTQTAFADSVTITTVSGSGSPGCENTSQGCFFPKELTVKIGETVYFENTDGTVAHTFTSGTRETGKDGVFDSSLVMGGGTFEWTTKVTGEYPYFCMIHPWMAGKITVLPSVYEKRMLDWKDQDTNDEISFSGFLGPMINCKVFSYEIPISIMSKTNVPVVIEIIDPDGNVAGYDKFDSDYYEPNRIIEMDWGKDGQYLILVQYKGDIYQEDFSYDKQSPEVLQDYRSNCLREKYVQPVREENAMWFKPRSNYNDADFLYNAQILEGILYDYDPGYFTSHYADFISADVVNATVVEIEYSGDLGKTFSVFQEIRAILPDAIGKRADMLYKKGEEDIIRSDISLDEKTELIFELRKYKERTIIAQIDAVEKHIGDLGEIFQSFHNLHEKSRIAAQKDRESRERVAEGIAKEKEAIRQEITNTIPEWVKNNAGQWSDEQIDDDFFVQGIRYLIQEEIIISPTTQGTGIETNEIPEWVKNNAKWWSDDKLTNYDFIKGIEYLLQKGIIKIN